LPREVPTTADSTLGMFIYDFYFDLEASDYEMENKTKTAVKNGNSKHQPSPKK
jgi:hypothetical protein